MTRPPRLTGPALVAVEKMRREVAKAHPRQTNINGAYITPKQAEALLRWIDRQQADA